MAAGDGLQTVPDGPPRLVFCSPDATHPLWQASWCFPHRNMVSLSTWDPAATVGGGTTKPFHVFRRPAIRQTSQSRVCDCTAPSPRRVILCYWLCASFLALAARCRTAGAGRVVAPLSTAGVPCGGWHPAALAVVGISRLYGCLAHGITSLSIKFLLDSGCDAALTRNP